MILTIIAFLLIVFCVASVKILSDDNKKPLIDVVESDVLLCSDCKHSVKGELIYHCKHAKMLDKYNQEYLITGDITKLKMPCIKCRNSPKKCGIEAKYFEAKDPMNKI